MTPPKPLFTVAELDSIERMRQRVADLLRSGVPLQDGLFMAMRSAVADPVMRKLVNKVIAATEKREAGDRDTA